jgi:hypothetical protein
MAGRPLDFQAKDRLNANGGDTEVPVRSRPSHYEEERRLGHDLVNPVKGHKAPKG